VEDAADAKQRIEFVRLPDRLYADDPNYVAKPTAEELKRLGPKNPYFEHAEAALFLARDGSGQAVGRISAQIDRLEQSEEAKDSGPIGHFGFIEGADESVLEALLEAAESWLRARGAARVTGPFSFSINDEAGLLVEGEPSPPCLLMNYAPAWYGPAIEARGYAKAKDLLAFTISTSAETTQACARLAKRALASEGLKERTLAKTRLEEEARTVVSIFNDSWSENWGFVPMTDAEAAEFARAAKPILEPDLVRFVELEGQPAAMIVVLPDMYEALRGIDGRLFPTGWAKLLWRLKVKGLSQARVTLLGIRKSVRRTLQSAGIAALLVNLVQEAAMRHGYQKLEMSWVLDDNHAMIDLIEIIGGRRYKTYRVYEKAL